MSSKKKKLLLARKRAFDKKPKRRVAAVSSKRQTARRPAKAVARRATAVRLETQRVLQSIVQRDPSGSRRRDAVQEHGDLYKVYLGKDVAEAAAELGKGSLSAGITAAVVRVATERLMRAAARGRSR